MVHPVHKDSWNLRLDALLVYGVISKEKPFQALPMGCSIIREDLAAFHSEMTEKIGRFTNWCICFIYHLQSGVYAIYITCTSIGKMAPLVYICNI